MPVLNLFKFWIFTIMAASFKLQYLIIISVFLHLRSSYGFPHHLLYNGVHIITYGKPCYSSYQLPVTIEGPVKECITEPIDVSKSLYRPLKLKYQAISKESSTYSQLQKQHPISIQIPQLMEKSKIIMPDCNQGKSYKYDVQTPSPSYQSMPHLMSYNFDLQVPSSTTFASPSAMSTPKSIEHLTDLTSKIDKILIPACVT